ncbi:MAG: hypothetical protein HOO96_10640 [Polyangiaceae bacterium]|nr:hypothetical protein [Polyangiaceae bacterium]
MTEIAMTIPFPFLPGRYEGPGEVSQIISASYRQPRRAKIARKSRDAATAVPPSAREARASGSDGRGHRRRARFQPSQFAEKSTALPPSVFDSVVEMAESTWRDTFEATLRSESVHVAKRKVGRTGRCVRLGSNMCLPIAMLVAVLAGCHRQPPRAAGSAPPVAASAPRVVCAPVQGPTTTAAARARAQGASDVVQTDDGAAVLTFHAGDNGAASVELTGTGGLAKTAKLPTLQSHTVFPFRGPNVVGFAQDVSPFSGGVGFVAWATSEPRALFVRRLTNYGLSDAVFAFNDKCKVHVIDLATGAVRVAPVRACGWFELKGRGIRVGRELRSEGWVTSVEYRGPALSLDTGKALPGAVCDVLAGGTCISFGGSTYLVSVLDEDSTPGPESGSSTPAYFDVRAASGEHVEGVVSIPHPSLGDYELLWRDAAAKTFAIVATRVEGKVGPQLVLVEENKVSVLPLSAEQWVDQRRISQLRDFVPNRTDPKDVDALIRERRKVFAASASDRVRFMEYSDARNEEVPCTRPPP